MKINTDHTIWWKYHTGNYHEPDKEVKMKLVMTETSQGSRRWKHSWRAMSEEQAVSVKYKWYFPRDRPYKDSQFFLGNCVQLSVNNVLGGKYWTNWQYQAEFGGGTKKRYKMIPYHKIHNKFNGPEVTIWPGTYWEAFDESTVPKALEKVHASETEIRDCGTLKGQIDWTNVIGIRAVYGSGDDKHSIAFKRIVNGGLNVQQFGTWWFIQSWFGFYPRKFKSKADLIQKLKSLKGKHGGNHVRCYLVKLDANQHGVLIPPDQVDHSVSAHNQYYNVLNDKSDEYEYDIEDYYNDDDGDVFDSEMEGISVSDNDYYNNILNDKKSDKFGEYKEYKIKRIIMMSLDSENEE